MKGEMFMTRDDIAPRRYRRPGRWPEAVPWQQPRHPARTALIGLALAAYAWIDGTAAPFTTRALVGVLIPGAVLVTIAYGWPPRRIPPPDELDPLGVSYWMICVVALFEWEASAFRDNSLPWHPSLTNLIDPLLAPHIMKSAAILVWMLAGWGLVKR
jgi:hypothetical protein